MKRADANAHDRHGGDAGPQQPRAAIGPRPLTFTCKGCPAYETEKWREPSGDGETYDNGQYAWCNAAEHRSMGAYHYDHSPTPEWCPAPPSSSPPPPKMLVDANWLTAKVETDPDMFVEVAPFAPSWDGRDYSEDGAKTDELPVLLPLMLRGLSYADALKQARVTGCALRRNHWCAPVLVYQGTRLVIDNEDSFEPWKANADDRRARDWEMVPRHHTEASERSEVGSNQGQTGPGMPSISKPNPSHGRER